MSKDPTVEQYLAKLHPDLQTITRELVAVARKKMPKVHIGLSQIVDTFRFTIREYKPAFYSNPGINFIIPWADKKLVCLQINFFRYEVRLPFRYVSPVLDALFREQKQRTSQIIPRFSEEEDKFLIIPINCMKIEPHECFFDLLLGKPVAS